MLHKGCFELDHYHYHYSSHLLLCALQCLFLPVCLRFHTVVEDQYVAEVLSGICVLVSPSLYHAKVTL